MDAWSDIKRTVVMARPYISRSRLYPGSPATWRSAQRMVGWIRTNWTRTGSFLPIPAYPYPGFGFVPLVQPGNATRLKVDHLVVHSASKAGDRENHEPMIDLRRCLMSAQSPAG